MVKVDGLLIVFLGNALINAMETGQVVGKHESRAEAIDIVCKLEVVSCVCVSNHHTWQKKERQKLTFSQIQSMKGRCVKYLSSVTARGITTLFLSIYIIYQSEEFLPLF